MAKLLTHIGISDAVIGIISSLVSFSFLFQLLAIFLMERLRNIKRTVIFFDSLSQLFFLGIYLTPFLKASALVKEVIVIACILLAYLTKYLITSLCYKWANSYVDPDHRGEFSAVKEMISLITGIIFTLLAGYVIDRFEALDNLEGGFLFIAVSMVILSICNVVCLLMIKNGMPEWYGSGNKKAAGLKVVMQNTLGNRNFMNVVIMSTLWSISRYMIIGFMGTFKTTDLLLSVGAIQAINMVANLVRLLLSQPFGRYSDNTSYATGYRLGMMMAAGAFAVNIFCTKQTWWCVVLFTILYNGSMAGINQNSSNIIYSYVKSEYVVQAMAIERSISGVVGFVAALTAGWILGKVQAAGNTFLGIPMYGQQLLSAIALVIVIVAIVFAKQVVEKQSRMRA
ncbi:MAG: MFS transporter [Oscillospiraceae bacterium]|nr:MFS transporter [Oscillospiraceae bacterium]